MLGNLADMQITQYITQNSNQNINGTNKDIKDANKGELVLSTICIDFQNPDKDQLLCGAINHKTIDQAIFILAPLALDQRFAKNSRYLLKDVISAFRNEYHEISPIYAIVAGPSVNTWSDVITGEQTEHFVLYQNCCTNNNSKQHIGCFFDSKSSTHPDFKQDNSQVQNIGSQIYFDQTTSALRATAALLFVVEEHQQVQKSKQEERTHSNHHLQTLAETYAPYSLYCQNAWDETFSVVDKDGNRRSFADYFLGWPGGKSWAEKIEYVLGGFLLTPLRNMVKLCTQFVFNWLEETCHYLYDRAILHSSPILAGICGFFRGIFWTTKVITRACLSPKASYEAASKIPGWRGTIAKIGSVLLTGVTWLTVGILASPILAPISIVKSIPYIGQAIGWVAGKIAIAASYLSPFLEIIGIKAAIAITAISSTIFTAATCLIHRIFSWFRTKPANTSESHTSNKSEKKQEKGITDPPPPSSPTNSLTTVDFSKTPAARKQEEKTTTPTKFSQYDTPFAYGNSRASNPNALLIPISPSSYTPTTVPVVQLDTGSPQGGKDISSRRSSRPVNRVLFPASDTGTSTEALLYETLFSTSTSTISSSTAISSTMISQKQCQQSLLTSPS